MRVLPEGWEWSRFDAVATIDSNLVDPSAYPNLPHIAPNHIVSRTGELLPHETIREAGVTSPKHLFSPGHILYSKIRPYLAKAVRVDFEGLCSADMYPISTSLDWRYLHQWIISSEFTALAAGEQGRSVLPKINQEGLGKLPVPVPPLAEQERIVAAIEEHLSRLDTGAASLRRAKEVLRLLRRLVLGEAFSGDAPRYALSEVARVVSGQTPKRLASAESGSVPFFKVGDMNVADDGVLHRSRTMLSEGAVRRLGIKLHPVGTIVFPKRGGAIATNKKRVLGVESGFDLNTMGVIPGTGLYGPYLRWWFETVDLGSLSDGSNVPQINHGDIEPLELPIPSMGHQQEVVASLDVSDAVMRHLGSEVDAALRRVGALRRSILAAAFSGRLVPQDRGDEPASVLLDRIQAERAASKPPKRKRKADVS